MFDSLIRQIVEQGIKMGNIQPLDSVHTRADVTLETSLSVGPIPSGDGWCGAWLHGHRWRRR